VENCLGRIAELFTPEDTRSALNLIQEVLTASGGLNEREVRFRNKVSSRLGVSVGELATSARTDPPSQAGPQPPGGEPPSLPPSRENDLRLLEIDPSTALTADLVRRQYHLLTERYAPGKLQAMGAEFVEMARKKSEEIRQAASRLLDPFGEPLQVTPPQAADPDLRHNPDLDAVFGG
jgi:hypothetical protein